MRREQLNFQGIQRNNPKGKDGQGTSHELINLRPKDGALRPVGQKSRSVATTFKQTKFIHKISDIKEAHWFVDGTDIGYVIYTNGSAGTPNTTFDTTSYAGAAKFSALGNFVIMMETNGELMQAYFYDESTGAYRVMGDLLPDLLTAQITSSTDGAGDDVIIADADWDIDDAVGREALLAVDLAEQSKNGYWLNRMFFRYAYELFDGSIVKASMPIRVEGGTFQDWEDDSANNQWISYFNKMVANFQIIDTNLATIKTNYKGIIKGINIYASRPKEVFESDTSIYSDAGVDYVEMLHTNPKLNEIDAFYLVRSYSLEELDTSSHDIFNGDDISDMSIREAMNVDNLTHHSLYSESIFNYNQRLMLARPKVTLFKGFNPDMMSTFSEITGSTYTVRWIVEVTLDTDHGQKIVRSDLSINSYDDDTRVGTFYCFAYPDSRAKSVRFLAYDTSSEVYYYGASVALTPHPIFNFAYIEDNVVGGANSVSLQTVNDEYTDYNRVQASEIFNPLYFPAINSYRVGHTTVLALASNAVPVSTGQAGQFPIYCFTKDGIWIMEVGSSDVFITAIKPIGRNVCNNAESIIPIDGGVLFSTDKGLFVISGGTPLEISQYAEGAIASPLDGLGSDWGNINTSDNAQNADMSFRTKHRTAQYGGSTFVIYHADSTGEFHILEIDHADGGVTEHDTGIADSGTIFDCSLLIDSDGYIYAIAIVGTRIAVVKSSSVGDASAFGSATYYDVNYTPGDSTIKHPFVFKVGTTMVAFGVHSYTSGATYYSDLFIGDTQEQVIVRVSGSNRIVPESVLDSDNTLHIAYALYDGSNYISLHYLKTENPEGFSPGATIKDITGATITDPDDGSSGLVLDLTGLNHEDITLVGLTVDDDGNPYIAALLTNGTDTNKLVLLRYRNSSWMMHTILSSDNLPESTDTDSVAFDGSIIFDNNVLRIAFPAYDVDDDDASVLSIVEMISLNKGLSWNYQRTLIPEDSENYICASYPQDMAGYCQLVALKGTTDYTDAQNVIFFINDLACQIAFKTYFEGSVFAYDFEENEIIVSNSSYSYSWVFNIDNKAWYKVAMSWDAFIPTFPGYLGFKTIGSVYYRYDMNTEGTSDFVEVLIETNPFTLNGAGYKKVLRGLVDAEINPYGTFTAHLYGSADGGNTYQLISSTSVDSLDNQLLIGRSRYSCQFFILVLSGKVYSDSRFNSFVADLSDKFQKKLR